MKKTNIRNILMIFSAVILLIAIGISLTIIFKQRTSENFIQYNYAFGNLPTPIFPNNVSVSLTPKVDLSQITVPVEFYNVYEINTLDPYYPTKEFAENTASDRGLKKEFVNEEIQVYSDKKSFSLEYDDTKDQITVNYIDNQIPQNPVPNENDAQLLAKDELEDWGLWPYGNEEDYLIAFQYYYSADFYFFETNEKEQAYLISVNFSSDIDSISKINSRINSGEIEVFLNSDKQVIKIVYNYRPVKDESIGVYPLRSIYTAYDQISNIGKTETVLTFESDYPSRMSITSADIKYRITSASPKYLQPVYVFEGTDAEEQLVTFIVPAIIDDYLLFPSIP
jgi:hypothetical protein